MMPIVWEAKFNHVLDNKCPRARIQEQVWAGGRCACKHEKLISHSQDSHSTSPLRVNKHASRKVVADFGLG